MRRERMKRRDESWEGVLEAGDLNMSFYVILLIVIEVRSPLESCLGPLPQEICSASPVACPGGRAVVEDHPFAGR